MTTAYALLQFAEEEGCGWFRAEPTGGKFLSSPIDRSIERSRNERLNSVEIRHWSSVTCVCVYSAAPACPVCHETRFCKFISFHISLAVLISRTAIIVAAESYFRWLADPPPSSACLLPHWPLKLGRDLCTPILYLDISLSYIYIYIIDIYNAQVWEKCVFLLFSFFLFFYLRLLTSIHERYFIAPDSANRMNEVKYFPSVLLNKWNKYFIS